MITTYQIYDQRDGSVILERLTPKENELRPVSTTNDTFAEPVQVPHPIIDEEQ